MPVLIGRNYVEGPYSAAGRSPLSLDAGIRMGQTWFPAFYYFLPSPSFGDEDVLAMLQSFRRHAEYLMNPLHFKAGSNWGAMESAGLLHIGCYLPEFRDAVRWRETAIERLYDELDRQVYPDGAQKELTPGYHGVTLRNMLGANDVAGVFIMLHLLENGLFQGKFLLIWILTTELAALVDGIDLGLHDREREVLAGDNPRCGFHDLLCRQGLFADKPADHRLADTELLRGLVYGQPFA